MHIASIVWDFMKMDIPTVKIPAVCYMIGCQNGENKMSKPIGYSSFRSHLRKNVQALDKNLKPAIMAKCYECMGNYDGGVEDCKIPFCPLYPWMPYKEKK